MSRDREYLVDIREAARLAMAYVAEKSAGEFMADVQCQEAVIRRLEVIGEAARRTSDQTRLALPEVPWAEMIGMRNIMIHRYDDVDLKVVWASVRDALPPVVSAIESILGRGQEW